jgi:hypothetical protein
MAQTHHRLQHDAELLGRGTLWLMLAGVWGAFAALAIGAAVFDIGRIFGAW